MAFAAFIKIDGIPGDSLDEQHKGWIEIIGYSFGAKQNVTRTVSSAAATAAGGVEVADFTFSKLLDSASAKLFEASCRGIHLKEVTLSLNRAGGEKLKYFEITLEEVLITNFTHIAENGEPSEKIRLNYGRIKTTYTHQNRANGYGGGKVLGGWDRIAKKAYA